MKIEFVDGNDSLSLSAADYRFDLGLELLGRPPPPPLLLAVLGLFDAPPIALDPEFEAMACSFSFG